MGIVSRMLTLGVVSAFSKFVVSVMNRATCSNYDTLLRHMTERERPRGLITVSNHASTFDDPGVLSYLIPARYFATEPSHGGVRWTICTAEICAASPLVHMFFAAGKTVPINRGGGLDQAVLRTMAERVGKGDWLHVFPEGKVSKTPQELGRLKWGLGKMLCDVHANGGAPPVVLPFWHSGMEKGQTIRLVGILSVQPRPRHRRRARRLRGPHRAVRTMRERRAEGGALQRHDGARGGEDARDEGQERARTTRRRCVSARKNRRARGEPATLPDVESNQPRQSFVCLLARSSPSPSPSPSPFIPASPHAAPSPFRRRLDLSLSRVYGTQPGANAFGVQRGRCPGPVSEPSASPSLSRLPLHAS